MSFLALKTVLSKSWAWIRAHWQIPFLLLWTILVYVLARRNSDALIEVIEAKKESYKKQVDALRRSHNDEILKRDKLTMKYEETLSEIERKYKAREKELSEAEKNEIKEVVIKSRGNSYEIRERIEKEFGLKFVE